MTMAHEELKALYEIDKQHSDTPWEFWQHRRLFPDWCNCLSGGPDWELGSEYRRKPDAPVWSDDEEDARKWRELDKHFEDAEKEDHRAFHWKFLDIKYGKAEPQLIQGYTADQWQTIIDGKFLCEFSDDNWGYYESYDYVRISVLCSLNSDRHQFHSGLGSKWEHCRPLRTKGVRQPWFGGECPISSSALVVVTFADGDNRCAKASEFNWHLPDNKSRRIVEFIEL